MASLNKVQLIGLAGKDCELRTTASGQSVASFSLATSDRFKTKSGEQTERTEWHSITVWGALADVCAKYVTKGKMLYLEGKIQTRKWQDKNGNDRYTTEIIADQMQLLCPNNSSPKSEGSSTESEYEKIDDPFLEDVPF